MPDLAESVLSVAALHAEKALPCPGCDATPKGRNLAEHLRKVHPTGLSAGLTSWRGRRRLTRLPVTVTLSGDALEARGLLRTRRVRLPAALTAGRLERRDDGPVVSGTPGRGEIVKAGTYLELSAEGSLRVGCRTGPGVVRHLTGTSPGKRRRHWHVTLGRDEWVALQYALLARGNLALR